jgi:hypothetical protein
MLLVITNVAVTFGKPAELKLVVEGDDGSAVRCVVGVDIKNAATKQQIGIDGKSAKGVYSTVLNLDSGNKEVVLPLEIPDGDLWKLYFEVYPKDANGKTDNSKYTSAVYQNFQMTADAKRDVHVTLQTVALGKVGYVTGTIKKDGKPWARKFIRLWGGPSGTDTGFDCSFGTDERGEFTSNPLKTFYIDADGNRSDDGCAYYMQVQNATQNFTVGTIKVKPGQTLDLGIINIP